MKLSPIRRLATTIVQLGIAAAIVIFYSKNIVSATVRAVLAGSVCSSASLEERNQSGSTRPRFSRNSIFG